MLQDSSPQPKSQGLFSKQLYGQDIFQANSGFQALNDNFLTESRNTLSVNLFATRNKPIQNLFGPEVNLNLPNTAFIQKSNFFGKPLQKPSFLTSQLPEANIFSDPCQTAQPFRTTPSVNHSGAWPATITTDLREDVNKQITGIRDFDLKKSLFDVNLVRPAIRSQANTDIMIEAKMSSDRKIDTEKSNDFMSCSFFEISEYVSGTANKKVIPSAEISNFQVKEEVSNNDQSLLVANVISTEPKEPDNQKDLLNRVRDNFFQGLKYTDNDRVIDPIAPNSSSTEVKYQTCNQDSARSNTCNQEVVQDNKGHNIVNSKRGNLFGLLQDKSQLFFDHHRSSKIQHISSTHPENLTSTLPEDQLTSRGQLQHRVEPISKGLFSTLLKDQPKSSTQSPPFNLFNSFNPSPGSFFSGNLASHPHPSTQPPQPFTHTAHSHRHSHTPASPLAAITPAIDHASPVSRVVDDHSDDVVSVNDDACDCHDRDNN